MHVFVTGCTGWIGGALAKILIERGHSVSGLVRHPNKADHLIAMGMRPVVGSLEDLDKMRHAALEADAVAHLAFNHDFSRFAENAEQDRRAIQAMGSVLVGSQRPLVVATGLVGLPPLATESDLAPTLGPRHSEQTARALADRGVRASTVRLPPSVHGHGDHGFLPVVIAAAKKHGVSGFLGDGSNGWGAVHRDDAAEVFLKALETGAQDPVYHAVADANVPFRDIAHVIGRRLRLPVHEVSNEHFGWFSKFAQSNLTAVSDQTRKKLGWSPKRAGLLEDLDQEGYFTTPTEGA